MKFKKGLSALISIVAGPLVIGLIIGYFGGWRFWDLDINRLASVYRGLGLAAVLISLVLNVLQTFVVVMPSVFLSGANAIVFGLFWGTVLSWIGETLGAAVAFTCYRIFGRETVAEGTRNRYVKRITELSGEKGFISVLTLRLLPAFPSGLVNLLAALSRVSFRAFIFATAIGKLPSLVMESFIGHDLFTWRQNLARLVIVLVIAIAVYFILKNTVNKRIK